MGPRSMLVPSQDYTMCSFKVGDRLWRSYECRSRACVDPSRGLESRSILGMKVGIAVQ